MNTGEPKILLVDDCREDRILMAQALSSAGLDCEIGEASDGEEAELYLERNFHDGTVPRLVILDLILPKRSGLEVMERWHAKGFTSRAKVVVLSSLLTESEVAKLHRLGACQVFEKPIDLDEFFALGRRMKDLAIDSDHYSGMLNQNVDPSPGSDSAQSCPP
jgi:DNA-binding response OmpR family regulator